MSDARLPLSSPEPDDELAAEVLAGFRRESRDPIALYRVLAHAPRMLKAFSGVGRGLRHQAEGPRELRELIVLRVAQLTGSDYEWTHHKSMALGLGMSERKLQALSRWRDSHAFDDRERAVLRCTEEVHGIELSDEAFAELERLFSPSEIVEIVLTAAHYQAVARVVQALGVEVEPEYEEFLE
jgi:4-carboxymuconolactone decarboxylase